MKTKRGEEEIPNVCKHGRKNMVGNEAPSVLPKISESEQCASSGSAILFMTTIAVKLEFPYSETDFSSYVLTSTMR